MLLDFDNLMSGYKTDFILMNKINVSDGEGGFDPEWIDGPDFVGVLTKKNSTLSKIAEKQGVTGSYSLVTPKTVKLGFPDVVKRVEDGSVYRITTKPGETETPNMSTMDLAMYDAEPWNLT